jgi:hypothetical protein
MICLNCKKQIPDNAPNCPNCGAPVIHEVQLGKEIKFRRWQRWFFYGVFILLFLGAVGFALKVYADNTALLKASTDLKTSLTQAQTDLAGKDTQLQQTQGQMTKLQSDLAQKQAELTQQIASIQQISAQKDSLMQDYDKFNAVLSAVNANTFNMIMQMGIPATFGDLAKIQVADYNLSTGNDSDGDGLSDLAEAAMGTDKLKKDTDSDGYDDKAEILNGYDPLNNNKYPLDIKYANSQKGKILISVKGNNEAWYVNPKDGKRYFLGRPLDAVKALEGEQKVTTPATVPATTTLRTINSTSTTR